MAFALPILFAHPGRAPEPHDLWSSWSFEPLVLLGLLALTWPYVRGVRTLWRRAGRGRGVRRWQAACFAAGAATLAIALISPLDALGTALFSAHMVQHLLLTVVAAPLLVLGSPVVATVWALPHARRRALARWWRRSRRSRPALEALLHPAIAWILATTALWAWHIPFYYDSAVFHEPVHALEHATFLGTSLLFWWALVRPTGVMRRAGGIGLIYLFTAAMQSGMLGALLTLSGRPWYAAHAATTTPWGLTPLEDQQLAGAIMWLPASLIYLAAMGVVFLRWVGAAERRARMSARTRAAPAAAE